MEDNHVTLSVEEKILRAVTNNNVTIPNLSYQNYILANIELEAPTHEYEVSVRYAGNELVKLSSTYFRNNKMIDLSGHRSKLEEGDNVDLIIRPKHKTDFNIKFHYNYVQNYGVLYYQNSFKYMDIQDTSCTLISDITQKMRPTYMKILTENPIKQFRLMPKFTSDANEDLTYNSEIQDERTTQLTVVFDEEHFKTDILKLLKYYTFELTLDEKSDNNSPIHILVYGFKQV